MNPPDIGTPSAQATGGDNLNDLPPTGWRSGLMTLIASRAALIQLESKDAIESSVKRASFVAAACGCAVFAWALFLAGGVSLISETAEISWKWVALGMALVHLLAAFILARLAKPSEASCFPVTRSEFQKDREWIENFQEATKSND